MCLTFWDMVALVGGRRDMENISTADSGVLHGVKERQANRDSDSGFHFESALIHHGATCIPAVLPSLPNRGLIFNSASGCLESEFEDASGKCVPCTQCGPGQELSEDCGSERDLRCVPCRPGRYKEDRGHQRCLRCLPCHIINRVLKANCTLTTNSVCGECLLGYYSKTRIGGLQELECFPCTAHTPSTESQCHPKVGPYQPVSTPSPPRDPVVLVAVIAVTLSLLVVALVTFSVICCGRFFKSQCQRAFLRSQDFAGQPRTLVEGPVMHRSMHSPCEERPVPPCCFGAPETCRQMQGHLEEIHAASAPSSTPGAGNILNPKQPSVELCMLPSDPVKPYYKRSVSETQPLIRNSACSDCFSSQEPQSTAARSCATEQQHWSHAPVECTELDLQNFSSDSTGSPNQSEHSDTVLPAPAAETHSISQTLTAQEPSGTTQSNHVL
ncbi:tumor necrosis factor receptor superfamily member 27 isoform X1 [Xenopus tropicalis]|uniref:Tumor necrosis factor receptor superfamily member 27 isoform X1 n=1 Tax=Xenopus tropicalis TaxID=8364 RepID=A0A8J0T3E2_XENTR|nr:tumor necrosis factor receptor superfamily member 27 isoform X1 [Xenopus tropicalis]|eukprot:XP_017952391.1 PREDICTED: tumor necrosis factor receptor superfamily member 27 isoform X2 [Xenopus tropicalis]